MNANINLLLYKDEEELKRKKRIRNFNFIALLFLIGAGVLSAGIFVMNQAANVGSLKTQQQDVLKKISKFRDQKIKLMVINNRTENIDKILKKRIDFPKITSSLLARMPGEISIVNFEIENGIVTISGESKSILAISELMDNLTDMVRNKETIKSLTLNSLVLDYDRNTYNISVESEL